MRRTLTLAATAVTLALICCAARAADLVVAPVGNDANPGTAAKPLATLAAARDAARKAGAGPHRIVVMPGEYFLAAPLELDARDNGLTIEAAEAGKAVLYGGKSVTGWQRDGDKFWAADLPQVKDGQWDFRALIVNGRMPERARLPESGTFVHQSVFDVPWLSSVGGGWARKPTPDELITMRYDPKDLPAALDVRNAELRVYHMWDESLVGIAMNDTRQHALTFTTPAKSPPGSFGVKKYVVFNTREGMTRAGQWYLDRTAGRVVYWPLPGEDMAKAKAIAPSMERLIAINGNAKKPVEGISLRGLTLQATTTPLKPAGFSAGVFDGALAVNGARGCTFEQLEICNVAGQGIQSSNLTDCAIRQCHVHDVGACAIRSSGSAVTIERNHLHHIGLHHPSAVVVSVGHTLKEGEAIGEGGFRILRNEVHDAPYSGLIAGGAGHLFEQNLIYRVMREMQDGGAIYGGMRRCILRGNVVRDVVKVGEGYGVSSYYLDEGAEDCIVERNVSIGVERPTHNHITRNLVIRDNVFVSEGDMSLSFPRSAACTFTGNTLVAAGKITVSPPTAVTRWADNRIFHSGLGKDGAPQAFTIDDAMPPTPTPGRANWAIVAQRVAAPPTIDGEAHPDEWPGNLRHLDRDRSRWSAAGAPVFSKCAYDDKCLYVMVNVVTFDVTKLSKGTAWGKDDGAEVCIKGDAGIFVLRGFIDGTCQSVTDAGAPADAAAHLGKAVRFAAKAYGKKKDDWSSGWRAQWAIPFDAIGLKPAAGLKVPFNLSIYRSADQVWRCLEGTLGETWQLDQATTLQLK